MKSLIYTLLASVMCMSTVSVAFAQEGDEAPEPTQSKTVLVEKANAPISLEFSHTLTEPDGTDYLYVAYAKTESIAYIKAAKADKPKAVCLESPLYSIKRTGTVTFKHRCSRNC